MPWLTAGMYSLGMTPPVILSHELVAAARVGLDVEHDVGVLAPATGLLDVLVVDLVHRGGDRLAVGDLGRGRRWPRP